MGRPDAVVLIRYHQQRLNFLFHQFWRLANVVVVIMAAADALASRGGEEEKTATFGNRLRKIWIL